MAQLKMWIATNTSVGSYNADELFSASSGVLPNYNSVTVQKYYPRKVGHTLMNGGFTTFTPNIKHRITMQFSFLTPAQYEKILDNFNKLVVIQPEYGTSASHLPDSFKDSSSPKQFKVLWADDAVNFNYTDTYKGAGYSGTINWLEV